MQTGYISFCDSIAFNIKSDKVKKEILENITNISNIKIIQKHFDVLNKNHFKKLNGIPHLVSLKSNGNPYLLFLTQYNNINISIFIDKKIQPGYFLPRMITSYFSFDDKLYSNTLFDGEMVKDNDNNWHYIINDIYIHKNKLLDKINILKRLSIIDYILNNNNHKNNICNFMIKKYFKYDELKYVIEDFNKKLNYTSRGIYFTPLYFKFKSILYNFDDSLISSVRKIKYQNNDKFLTNNNFQDNRNTNNNTNNNTINNTNNNTSNIISNSNDSNNSNKLFLENDEFYLEKTDMPDVYNMYKLFNNNFDKFDIAHIPNIKSSKYMREIFENVNIITKLKFKCKSINKNNKIKWIPYELLQ